MLNPAETYAATRDQLIAEVRSLDSAQASTPIPSCPGWSASDVVAHVAGLVADLLAGKKPPLGTDEMTARQVNERRGLSHGEVCDEWAANAAGIAEFFESRELYALGLTADLAVHVHDLAEKLDAISPPPPEATLAGCERYVPLVQERAAEQCDIAFAAALGDRTWTAEAGSTPLTLRATPTEFLRGVTGRRTRAEVAGLDWDGDPSALLDKAFTQYGPFRSSDA